MNAKSIWAVVAGVLFIIIITTLVDVVCHAIGIFPPMQTAINDTQALIATSYRIVISIAGGWSVSNTAGARSTDPAFLFCFPSRIVTTSSVAMITV